MAELVNLKGPWTFASNGEVLDEAIEGTTATRDSVGDYLELFKGYVNGWKSEASGALNSVSEFTNQPFLVENAPPLFNVDYTNPTPNTFDAPDVPEPLELLVQAVAKPTYEPFAGINVGGVPEFTPSILTLDIPDQPANAVIAEPGGVPALDAVSLPAEGDLVIPDFDNSQLAALSIPDFMFPVLPDFTGVEPTLTAQPPDTVMDWTEPTYYGRVLEDVVREIKRMLAGGTGMHPHVEQALFSRARAKEDTTALKATQEAVDTWAGRGFTMPPGMLTAQVNAIQLQNQLQVNALLREIFAKSAEWEIENLRHSVQQGIALEGMLLGAFNNAAARAFEAAKYAVESRISLFNIEVTAFNARSQAYQVAANVFKVKVEAELQKLEEFKVRVQAEQAKGELNKVIVSVYNAQMSAVQSRVDLYKARVQAALSGVELNKARIEGYKAEVEAYGERVKAEKTKFDAYSARVAAEGTKAQILEAEARAFASRVQAFETSVRAEGIASDAVAKQNENLVRQYSADIEAERSRVAAVVQVEQAKIEAFKAEIQKFSTEVGADSDRMKNEIQLIATKVQGNATLNELQYKRYADQMNRLVEQMKLKSDQLKAIAQLYSQLTSGALSAMHLSESISASTSLGASANTSTSDSTSKSYSESQSLSESHSTSVSN